LQQEAGGVVDSGDVIRIKGMTEAEAVGQRAQSGHCRKPRCVKKEDAPGNQMKQADESEERTRMRPSDFIYAAMVQMQISLTAGS
jgi:hypothetical protein